MKDLKYQMSERLFNLSMTNIKKISSGIDGLDKMLGGGFLQGHIIVIMGGAGTGKTTFCLQYIMDGLIKGENGIYITIEEDKDSIISTAHNYGWGLDKFLKDDKLTILKLDLADITTTARRIKIELPSLIKNFGAKRLVIDSITLFNMMFENPIERRIRLTGLINAIKSAGITALFTSETENGIVSKDGMIEYSADGVILLKQVEENKNIGLELRIIKMRRTQHDRSFKNYQTTEKGIILDI